MKRTRQPAPSQVVDYAALLRTAGIPQKIVALAWNCRANLVTQKVNCYLPITKQEEKILIRILKTAETTRGNYERR